MPPSHPIDYVEFSTNDLSASKKFFREAFDWKFVDYGTDYSAFNTGQMRGGFFSAASSSPASASPSVPASSPNNPLIVLQSDDLNASVELVVKFGATISKPILAFPGGERFHFLEPGGNELAIWRETL
jgi:hypothetical protein